MAGRKPLAPGELGAVKVVPTPSGGYSGRARTRDGGGIIRRLRASASTEAEVIALLEVRARETLYMNGELSPSAPLSIALDMWIKEKEFDESVKPQTLRIYKDNVRWLTPYVGALPLDSFTPKSTRQLLKRILEERSSSAVDQARTALNGAFGIAVEEDAMEHNPLILVKKRAKKKPPPTALPVEQVHAFRCACRRREVAKKRYVGESIWILGWVIEIILASGLRISEVLALRHCDVDFDNNRIEVTGTLVDDIDDWHLIRQEELKSREQARFIDIASYGMAALKEARRNATTISARLPEAPAIQGRATGKWVGARSVRRSLRTLREDPELVAALATTGLKPTDLKPHLLRRTAATLVAAATGDIRNAQFLLGHGSESTTKASYAGRAWKVVGSAAVLDSLLGEDNASDAAVNDRSGF